MGRESKMALKRIYPMLQALLAAALFGASAPLSKFLLGEVEPIPLASLLYLGSGLSALLLLAIQHKRKNGAESEAGLSKPDLPWLIGAIFAGGVAAPIVLMFSLQSTPAATASLLLNFEVVATTLIAAIAFREAVGRRVWGGIILITLSSVLLSWNVADKWGISLGALGVLAACTLWGIDNNFTRNISAKNPLIIVAVKGIAAGTFSLLITLILGGSFPHVLTVGGALLLGAVSYGLSIMLFILALRSLGAARTIALFGTAPFIGALLSFLIFRETISASFIFSLLVMVVGAFLLVTEEHEHQHHHLMDHDHRHSHDDGHHDHTQHPEETSPDGSHSHAHQHPETEHTHSHTPDIHHRHTHSDEA